ncbi:MAG: hypothetical protein N4A38_04765 [Candidatus Gracilibacteria bacterium]|nr:hypothetical protein [Candidatus Gracilibacteria bacterium]
MNKKNPEIGGGNTGINVPKEEHITLTVDTIKKHFDLDTTAAKIENLKVSKSKLLEMKKHMKTVDAENRVDSFIKLMKETRKEIEHTSKATEAFRESMEKLIPTSPVEQAKTWAKETKEKGTATIKSFSEESFFKSLPNKIGEFFGGIWKWIKKGINGILGLFGMDKFFDTAEKAKGMADSVMNGEILEKPKTYIEEEFEKISQAKITEMRTKVENKLVEKLGIKDEKKKKLLKELLENPDIVTKEDLVRMSKTGITIEDLAKFVNRTKEKVFTQEELDEFIEKGKDLAYKKFEHWVVTNFGEDKIDSPAKRYILKKVFNTKINLSDSSKDTISNIKEKQGATGLDLAIIGGDFIGKFTGNGIGIIFALFSEGIITMSDVAFSFGKTGGDIIEVGFSKSGAKEYVDSHTFAEHVESMSDVEKAAMLGLLYRKGGFLFNILGHMGSFATSLLTDRLTPQTANSLRMKKNFMLNDYKAQIKEFEKIEKLLQGSKTAKGGEVLREALHGLQNVRDNYKTLDILDRLDDGKTKKAGALIKDTKSLIQALDTQGIEIPKGLKSAGSLSEARNILANNFRGGEQFAQKGGALRGIKSTLWGIDTGSTIHQFNKSLADTVDVQKKLATKNIDLKRFLKPWRALESSRVGRMGERLVFKLDDAKGIEAFKRNMIELGRHSPDLVKKIFRVGPILCVAGGIYNNPKDWAIQLAPLIPILGPIGVALTSGVDWSNWKDGEIKFTGNYAALGESAMWLGLDLANRTPITAPIRSAKNVLTTGIEFGQTVGKGILKTKPMTVVKTIIHQIRRLKPKEKVGLAIAATLILATGITLVAKGSKEHEDLLKYDLADEDGNLKDPDKANISLAELKENKAALKKYIKGQYVKTMGEGWGIGMRDIKKVEFDEENKTLQIALYQDKYLKLHPGKRTLDATGNSVSSEFETIASRLGYNNIEIV